ncbi:hypothetical protein OAG82_02690 [Rubripirellula sp.]|nr:hypothetical protein [Rubripirellula sp.]MDB4621745.1 hypothetical protein [Rubripirellula sp.]
MSVLLRRPVSKPHIDPYEDALGKSGGNRDSPYSREAKFYAAVQEVKAMGRRPQDWMKRDLLAGAAGDDRRNFPQRQLLKNKSTFLEQNADAELLSPSPKVIRELRAFDYLSRQHLLEMKAAMPDESSAQKSAMLASVCPTSLYLTGTLIPHSIENTRRFNQCNNTWVCPHCYARRMAEQYQSAAARLEHNATAYVALLSRQAIVALGDSQDFHCQRKVMRDALQAAAESLGVTGGLSTVQVGPTLQQQLYWDRNEACYEDVQQLVVRVAVFGSVTANKESLSKLHHAGQSPSPPETAIDLLPSATPGAPRTMFVKARNSSYAAAQLTESDYGLFHWPTMTLCSPHQWQSRFEMTRNLKCVQPWGDWRKNAKKPMFASTCDNEVTAAKAAERRADLLKAVHAAGPDTASMGRVALLKFLQSKELDVSQRDVRWLVTQRKQKEVA